MTTPRPAAIALHQAVILAALCLSAVAIEAAPPAAAAAPTGFSEPSLAILGTSAKKSAVMCIRSGGNFYYHGGVVCIHLVT
jgi:hypothetical protein